VQFYSNEIKSTPRGDYIDNIHRDWKGEYELLESHHGYIQWLFPIREEGMNFQAQRLHLHEMKTIKGDTKCCERLITSYELMLDFYGMVLLNRETGELGRNPKNWKDRYHNLNTSFHNYLRITRILKCLGELGYEHYKMPFLIHLCKEFEDGKLGRALDSCKTYWAPILRDDNERKTVLEKLIKLEKNYIVMVLQQVGVHFYCLQ